MKTTTREKFRLRRAFRRVTGQVKELNQANSDLHVAMQNAADAMIAFAQAAGRIDIPKLFAD
jgi:hypothetical protein